MRVKFKVLKTKSIIEMLDVLTGEVIKEYSSGRRVAILAPSELAKRLDDQLWQSDQDSFIPHHCAINAREYNVYKKIPILITDNLFIVSDFDILINIMDVAIDPQKVSVHDLIEFVYQEDKALQLSRKKYVYYKKLNLEISTIQE